MRLATTLCLVTVSVAVKPGLFGLTDPGGAGSLALVSIDPKTGKQTTVGNLIPGEAQAQALATIDDQNGVYYILGYDGKAPNIMGIDITTGAVVSEAEIPAFATEEFVGVGQGIDWEPDTGSVVAAGQDSTTSWSIGLVNPKTGKFAVKAYVNNSDHKYNPVLGSPSVYTTDQQDFVMLLGVMPPVSTVDLLAVNIPTGKFAPLPWCGGVETTDYDLVSKAIYGIGFIPDPAAPGGAVRTLLKVQSDASSCSVVGNITGYWIISAGVSAIDTDNRVLYFLSYPCVNPGDPGCIGGGSLDLVGVDLPTGKIVSVAPAFCNMLTCPWSLEYANPVKQD